MKHKSHIINESILDSLLQRVKVLESLLLEGKRDQEILNNFLGDDYYDKYNLIKNRISDPEYKDIYKMIKMDPDDVKDYIDSFQSKSNVKQKTKSSGATKLYEDSDWVVYRITSYDSAKYYGKGTKWCISGNYDGHAERGEDFFNDYINDYNLDGGYYFYINKSSGDKYCLLQDVNGRVRSIWDDNDRNLGSKNIMKLPIVPGVNLNVTNQDEILLDGVRHGDATLVKKALSAGADVNLKDEYSDTALVNATRGGYPEIVKLLLDAGADIDAKNKYGITALMRAVTNNNIKIAKLLLDTGANVNAKDNDNETALMRAVTNNNIEIVKLLLDAGADVNIIDVYENTALKKALRRGYDDIAELLISHGAKSESRRKYNRLNRKHLY